jgi:hypothetical protein
LETKTATHKCPHCNHAPFISRTGLGSHLRAKHNIIGTAKSSVEARAKNNALVKPLDAPTASQVYNCPQCDHKPFTLRGTFAKHLRHLHQTSIKELKNPPVRKPYTKRGTTIEQPTKALTIETRNGNHPQASHDSANGYAIPEGTLALALGRFQGFSVAMATEFDLPPKLFTTELARLIYHASVRK